MNPSASGWINKLLRSLFHNKAYAAISLNDLYDDLRLSGFLYGSSMRVVGGFVDHSGLTREELSKLNLLIALNCAYKESENKKPFIKGLIHFYKSINQHKTNLFDDLFGQKLNATTLERIIHRRVQIDPNFITKNFNYFVTNALLFLDVLAYIQYLETDNISEEYLKTYEATIEAVTYSVLESKSKRSSYDNNLMDLIEASLRYQDFKRIDYDHAISHVRNIPEGKYLFDIACMTSWSDHEIDKSEYDFLNSLGRDLNLDSSLVESAIADVNTFYTNYANNLGVLSSKNVVRAFYDNSSRMVTKLLSRNAKRLQRELNESKEVMQLITKSTVKELTSEEQKQLQNQLLDIFKTIPSLAIFMLPGGALLLPLVVKFIPKLLPSAFDDNRIEDE
ncbi:MAG: hypothetical protein KJN59_12055 [Bacteroidia bacterium]|nr:hypothetical protein [Bacteroidia bacterium]